MQTMNDLFLHFLKDMYYAEQQTLRTFPQMMSAVQSQALKQAFEQQAQAARNTVAQLEKVFAAVGQRPEGATCEALLGMVKETEELLKETGKAGPVQDAGLIAGIQAIQHYAIARYGSLLAWRAPTMRLLVAYCAVLLVTLMRPIRGSLGPPSCLPSPRSPSHALRAGE